MPSRNTRRWILFLAAFLALAGRAGKAEGSVEIQQDLSVTRPAGQLVLRVEGSRLTVTDKRSEDPGWSVSGVEAVERVTAGFTDGGGHFYGQQVSIDNGVASAPAHRGLGIAHLTIAATTGTITITVI